MMLVGLEHSEWRKPFVNIGAAYVSEGETGYLRFVSAD
jgi:hypothetical protein